VRNIKLTIEYEGTEYEGWQVQNPSRSVPSHFRRAAKKTLQAELEKALRMILREKVRLTGSGRTDAGVHACGQVANFHTVSAIPLYGLQKALNAVLHPDISISSVKEVPAGFHSRFSAKGKFYRYTILNRAYPSSLRRNFVLFCDYPLNVSAMAREARVLKGTHDFRSFHSADEKERSSVRTIRRIAVVRKGEEIHIDIEANGFLKTMVRTIAGTLIEIGRGRFPAGSMKMILAARNRTAAGPTASPQGLCLMRVKY
jgi:tRNA pseudouridine38-40 synthase